MFWKPRKRNLQKEKNYSERRRKQKRKNNDDGVWKNGNNNVVIARHHTMHFIYFAKQWFYLYFKEMEIGTNKAHK